jgi:hypothetical protein
LKFHQLLILTAIIAGLGWFGYQQYTKKPAQECVNSKLPPAADGTVYELKVCINGGKELNITFPDALVGVRFPVKFKHKHNCEEIILAEAGEPVPKNLKKMLPTTSESEIAVIGNKGKTCPAS